MTYTLKLHGVTIGRSDLEQRAPAAQRAWGTFRRGGGYELVEPVFLLRGTDPKRYAQARDALTLQLVDASDTLVETSALDLEAGPDGALVLHAVIPDATFWRPADAP
jgi:hypothetical protein